MHGCATGVFSGRELERAIYDPVAFRFIAANDHPDHDTIAKFRCRFLKKIEALFVHNADEYPESDRLPWPRPSNTSVMRLVA